MSAFRNLNSRRDAPHERAELIDRIAGLAGGREISVSIDGRPYQITLEAYLGHLSNAGLVELCHAASAAALCVTRLVASEDRLRLAGPVGDVEEVAKKILGVAADLVRLEALGLDAPVSREDLAQLARSAGGDEAGGEREAEANAEAGEIAPVGGEAVAGGVHDVLVRVTPDEADSLASLYDPRRHSLRTAEMQHLLALHRRIAELRAAAT